MDTAPRCRARLDRRGQRRQPPGRREHARQGRAGRAAAARAAGRCRRRLRIHSPLQRCHGGGHARLPDDRIPAHARAELRARRRALASAYNLSNTLPNVVYNLAIGGILTSVIVPLIVAAGKRGRWRPSYDQRMFTLVTMALLAVTVAATVLAVPIVHLYSGSTITGHTEHLAVIFALFFIPQIFFYGVSSLIGAILNARGSFAAPMWTPIVNNVVVIAVLGLYVAWWPAARTRARSPAPRWRSSASAPRSALSCRLSRWCRRCGGSGSAGGRGGLRRAEAAEIGRMGGWMFGYVAATQVAFLVTTKVAGDTKTGITVYNYSWLLFQLPYAVVGISVITALLPRMSPHASERRLGLVRQDFSAGVRLAAAIVVPCSLVLAVLGPRLGEVFFGHGRTT